MNIRLLLASALATTFLLGCAERTSAPLAEPTLIPLPASVSLGSSAYQLGATVRVAHSLDTSSLDSLQALLQTSLGGRAVEYVDSDADLSLWLDTTARLAPEGYRLHASQQGVAIEASTLQGLRYGLQTLRQLTDAQGRVYEATIEDAPRFAYRGVMLDVSRHMMSKDYILRLLDEMARLKLNRFHWHLVDGGGWRMQSDAYPLLTKRSAWRPISAWDEWWGNRTNRQFVDEGTPGAYGGYYTKDEIREVVAHAARLGITILPEIEMPGHSNELFASYPELFCRSEFDPDITDVCIGNEATFTFFERILDETMELFPSQYIHIGGDEAAMNHWGDCPKCRARMRTEGLQDLHALQSYMIRRIERYLSSKGRKLMGWDEILLGGLAPEATVMSWRGEAGGIAAAKAGHDVVMTPNNYLYLDYYQTTGLEQPRANGSYVPLQKVYAYDPEPQSLSPQERKHILGVQANLWTEYVETEAQADYMLFPRLLALAEVAWTPQSMRRYDDFRQRAMRYTDALIGRGINAFPLTGVTTSVGASEGGDTVRLSLVPERTDLELRYTLDGTAPTATSALYSTPIATTDSARVRYNLFRSGQPIYATPRLVRLDRHQGMDAVSTSYAHAWNSRYPAGGDRALIDGTRGTPTFTDGLWQGFTEPLDITIDLGEVRPLRHIYATYLQEREHWVYTPRRVEVWISADGKGWTSLGALPTQTDEKNPRPTQETFDFYTSAAARYVRMNATIDRSPGHFIFTDEIVIQ